MKVTIKKKTEDAPPERGPAGKQGLRGSTGPAGKQGERGKTGATGPVGPKGSTGRQGLKGSTGRQGEKGEIGPVGPRGFAGKDGGDGDDGLDAYDAWIKQGHSGSTADFVRALKGTPGKQGEKGERGPRGIKGLKGDRGEKGNTGSRGADGWGGGVGPAGPAGAPGAALDGEPNGFEDRTDVTLAWDDGTRTLTLTGTYSFYSDGTSYDGTGGTIQISDAEGAHFIYYDADGDLQEQTSFDISLIKQYCLVAYIYWDTDNNEAVPWVTNELHGASMSPDTHLYLHSTVGAAYVSGMGLSGMTVAANPTGAADAQCQFTASSGEMRDEDIPHLIETRSAITDTIPVLWKEGTAAAPVWRMDDTRSCPVTNEGTTAGRTMWNELTGGSWQLTEISADNRFVLSHLYAVPGLNPATGNLVAIVGEAEYQNVSAARAGAQVEAAALALDGLPSLEFVLVATVIAKTNSGWANTPKAGFVTTDTGDDYIDWRQVPVTGSSASTAPNHNLLPGIQGGQADEYYHLTEAEHTAVLTGSGHGSGSVEQHGDVDLTDIQDNDGLIWSTDKFVPSALSGATWLEEAITPTLGQITFILSQAPTEPASLSLHANGIEAKETDDYTLSGTTLTWLNSEFSFETNDDIVIKYK